MPAAHAPESAGRHLVTRLALAGPDERIGAVLARLRATRLDYAGAVYVVDSRSRLVGEVPMTTLLATPLGKRLRELMHLPSGVASPEMDQERAASIALRHGRAAVPVVDGGGRLLGVLPPEALIQVLRAEHVEDLHRLAGIRREQRMARQAIEASPFRRARDRLPWLLIGLAGSAVATLVMVGFETTLEATAAVAFFVPGIVYLADAIGTQTEAIAVRDLSLAHEPIGRLVWGELRTGLLMGMALAAIALPGVWLAFGNPALAAAVAAALLGAGAVATTIGLILPWALARAGRDPAYGSGPLATVVQDIASILIYLTIVSVAIG